MVRHRQILPLLNALPAFEQAARVQSFTEAAKLLGMTQPSVSRFIAKLESHIGVPLFDRLNNRIALTPEGEKLYKVTSQGLGEISKVMAELNTRSRTEFISIGCTHGFAHMWLLPRLEKLGELFAGTEIRLNTVDQNPNFSVDEVDLAIRFGDGNWSDGEAWLLFEEEAFPVCSPQFAKQHGIGADNLGAGVAPEDITQLPLLVQDQGENGWMCWPQWFEHFEIDFTEPDNGYRIPNYSLVLQAAMAGDGIALAWQNLVEPYLKNRWLIELPGQRVKTNRGYFLVFASDSPVAKTARAWVQEQVST